MPRLTAIEFSEETCVLVRTAFRGTSVEVLGVDILDPAAFPGGGTLAAALRQARRADKLPRRARVVLWGLPDGATPNDAAVRPRLEPLIDAGFRIERVVSPCNALAALARIRTPRPQSATIWLAIDRRGVAIVAARPGELLYSHAFTWDSSIGAMGSQARLLQRYSLVSFLAPEVRRAMAVAREKAGGVDAVVTCGTFPDLRSLTMPLIEELDVEVETLDSLDGLTVKPSLRERLSELAPTIRIACAGAVARPSRPRLPATARAARWFWAAALVALLALAAIGAALLFPRFRSAPPSTPPAQSPQAVRQPPSRAPGATILKPSPSPSPSPSPPPQRASQPAPVPPVTARALPHSSPAVSPPVQSREPRSLGAPQPTPVPSPAPEPVRTAKSPLFAPAPRADKVRSGPLTDPLPNVTTILVSPTRRFAMVDGRIVGVGDRVGQRTIAAIEPHVVVFREPSGVQIRVGLSGRPAVEDRFRN